MIQRLALQLVTKRLYRNSAVVLLGARQSGKTTLAMQIAEQRAALYFDLERQSDRSVLQAPENILDRKDKKLVILDEIQRAPGLFAELRGIIDRRRHRGDKFGQFLLLGSASGELLQQSSESLAGRISNVEIFGLNVLEVPQASMLDLWVRGGFPDSFLAESDEASYEWRLDFVRTYLEQDVRVFAPRIPTETLGRLWAMLGHLQGGMLNMAKLSQGLDITIPTVHRYVDLLVDMLLIRRIQPWSSNQGKRLVKSPKIYIRDSGVLHALLGIRDLQSLLRHPVVGNSWEGFVVENILSLVPYQFQPYFYRTQAGAEIDLVLEMPNQQRWAIEIKRSVSPVLSKGFHLGAEDIAATHKFLIYSGEHSIEREDGLFIMPLKAFCQHLAAHIGTQSK